MSPYEGKWNHNFNFDFFLKIFQFLSELSFRTDDSFMPGDACDAIAGGNGAAL